MVVLETEPDNFGAPGMKGFCRNTVLSYAMPEDQHTTGD